MSSHPRVVLVTGASSGIGRATARRLAGRGDHVVLLARALKPLQETANECEADGASSVLVTAADVTDVSAVEAAVQLIISTHGRLDEVVHSAGVVAYGDFLDIPTEIFDRVIATNVSGSANVARCALRVMRDQGHGSVVLLSSVIGHIAVPSMSPYVVSKWAIRALARELQLEHRNHQNVHISCVSPGSVDTPIYLQGATYAGAAGRPPPPVVSPEHVAKVIVRTLDQPRPTVQVGPANRLMQLGFTLTPRLFDALVGPLAALAALERETTPSGPGNVLNPRPELNRVRGNQGNSSLAMARAILERTRTWVRND